MKVVVNLKLVRKFKIFTRLSLAGMLIFLVAGLIFAFFNITPYVLLNFVLATFFIVATYTLLRLNGWLSSRWGSNPRLDEKITDSLKGLADDYVIYHYVTDVPHVLMGPNGISLLEIFDLPGKIQYDKEKNSWRYAKKGNFLSRIFQSEKFTNPEKESVYVYKDWDKFLARLSESDFYHPGPNLPKSQTIIVFPDENTELQVIGSPIPLTKLTRLKELIRGLPRLLPQEGEALKEFMNKLPGGES